VKTLVFSIAFFILSVENLLAQAVNMYQTQEDVYTRFQNFSTQNGLSSNSILGIVQDPYGMMWFATMDGLNRFDGYQFTVFRNDPKNPNSLSDNFTTCVEVDVYGNLWIGTQNGLNKFNPITNTFTRYFKSENNHSISNNYIKALLADQKGYLWIDSKGTALDRMDITKQQFVHIPHKNGEFEGNYYYHQIFKDSQHNIWMGGRTFFGFKIPNSQPEKTIANIPIQNNSYQDVNTYSETSNHQIIGCTYTKAVVLYNPDKNLFENIPGLILPGNPCRSVTDTHGNIWVGGYNGLQCIDLQNKKMTTFNHQPMNEYSIPSNTIYYVYKDRNGNIWLGTSLGVSLYSEKWNQIRHYRQLFERDYSLTSNHISALMQDRDGLLWVGLEHDGVDTMSLHDERFGNMQYNLLNQKIDEKTFWKEREILKEYFNLDLIKSKDINRNATSIFNSYQTFKSAPLTFANANENEITSVFQDSKKQIYMSIFSGTGINRFDKKTKEIKRFAIHDRSRNEYIYMCSGGNWPVQFWEDSKDRLWCVTWEGLGLNLFDRDREQFVGKHFLKTNITKGFTRLMQYDQGYDRIWGNSDIWLFYYDVLAQQHHKFGAKLNPTVSHYESYKSYYQNLKCDWVDYPMDFKIHSFALDQQGNIWLGGNDRLVKMDIETQKIDLFSISKKGEKGQNDIGWMWMDVNAHKLWFSSNNALFQMDLKTEKIIKNQLKNIEDIKVIKKIDNRIWIGAQNGIWLYLIQNNTYHQIPSSAFKTPQPITDITQIVTDPQGNIWFNCSLGLIKMNQEKEIERYTFQDKQISGTAIQSLHFDPQNQLWIGTNNGLVVLNPISKKFQKYTANSKDQFALIHNNIHAITDDLKGKIYISTQQGLCYFEPKSQRFINVSQTEDFSISTRLGSCMMEDHQGNLWYGTTEKGLNKIENKTEKITHFIHHDWDPNSLVSNQVTCLWEDRHHQIWIGTDKGLERYDATYNQFKHYSTNDGLPDLYIMGIVEDQTGNLWISTHKGLVVYQPKTRFFRQFYRYHGLADDEFTDAVCLLQNGQMAWGSYNGFITFSPEDLTQKWKTYQTVLFDFKVNNLLRYPSLHPNQQINLKYADHSFSVQFTSTEFPYAKTLRYRYKLVGFEQNWNHTDYSMRIAKYTNLKWGNYTLLVEVSNPFGEFQGSTNQIQIHIQTPWFASWWFILLTIGLLLFSMYKIIRYREKKLQKENELLEHTVKERTSELLLSNEKLTKSEFSLQKALETKDKFFSIISHDLRNPSRSMNQMAEMLYQQYEKMEPKQAGEFLKLLSETAKNNNQLIENLLYWSISQKQDFPAQPSLFNLNEAVENVILQVKSEAEIKQIEIIKDVDTFLFVWADKAMIETVLRNLISNAIKYSFENAEIIVSAREISNSIQITITDFGTGMEPDEVEKLFKIDSKLKKQGTKGEKGTGLGLILCAEFIQKNNGTIFAQSVKNQKTIITFTLPKNA
jgi:ligand-binding sensor domain-containing protein/signal transduction histidine kinase